MTRAGADKDRDRRLMSSVAIADRKHRALSAEQRGGLASGMEFEAERLVKMPRISFLERRFTWEKA